MEPLHRVTDPWTSRAAADSVKMKIAGLEQVVVDTLRGMGPMTSGEIQHELEQAGRIAATTRIHKRMAGLIRQGRISAIRTVRRRSFRKEIDVDQILSLCSGIGGLDLGLHEGLRAVGREPRTLCMVEREAFAVAILGKAMQEGRLDECPIWCGDLRDLPCDELPAIDWITGGYPCQPFSHAGKRMGEDDPRHLWPAILELVRTLRPGGVFFENVAGHMSLGLDRVLQDLAGCGFRSAFGLFTAEEVGAPHRRERVFILGLADAGLHDEAARRQRADAAASGRVRSSEGRGGCNARERHREAAGQTPGVADASGVNRRSRPEDTSDRQEPAERGQELADADKRRRRQDWESDEQGTDRIIQPSEPIEAVADADGSRSQGRRRLRKCPFEWISRPGCPQRPDEPPRTVERGLGRGSDGLPDRLDRLRALGNAVVWQQAAHAFETLYRELTC
jgi:DNA (cytosine-5)-methyltransferase 1